MTIRRNRFVLAAAALIGLTVTTAFADAWNKETSFRFSAPVEVPGKMLPPGKYVFRLLDSFTSRNLIEVFSEDDRGRRRLVTTFFAIPDYSLKTPEKTMIQFDERRGGNPEAIKSWFYPGDNYGFEFAYPKPEQLAAGPVILLPEPPPATTPVSAEEPTLPAPPPVAEPAASVFLEEEEWIRSLPEPEPEPLAAVSAEADRVLPETAGESAWLLLAGVIILGAGVVALSISRCEAEA